MRVLTLCLGMAIILTAACSDGSKGGAGGAAGGALQAGGQGAGGVTALGGSTGTLTGACANLTCMDPMMALLSNPSCQPSATDTCTQQIDLTTFAVNDCYVSGVKTQVSMSTDMTSATMTVKGGGSVCYSMAVTGDFLTLSAGGVVTIAIKNASGTTVATMTEDTTASATNPVYTVTCPGGVPTVVDSSCGSSSSNVGAVSVPGSGSTKCATGACTF